MLTTLRDFFSRHGTRLSCIARRLLRRWSWFYLFVGGLCLYPAQIYWQVRYAVSQAASGDAVHAATLAMTKVVAPSYVLSKMSIAIGVFCLINLLAWSALNMVIPVLPDWAKGDYASATRAEAVGLDYPVVGMKRTFLRDISPLARIALFFVGFGLQLFAAGLGVYAAFQIQ
jgi:hypothetical protein